MANTKPKSEVGAAEQSAVATASKVRRESVSQKDVPAYPLQDALKVPIAIVDNYGAHPTAPFNVAKAMQLSPTSSTFKMLCGASIAYGLTEGGYNADAIKINPLAKRIIQPTEENDDVLAMREAVLRPKVLKDFLNKYNKSKFPRQDIAINVLVDMGVPKDSSERTLLLIQSSAEQVGYLEKIKDATYVNLSPQGTSAILSEDINEDESPSSEESTAPDLQVITSGNKDNTLRPDPSVNRRVFITHGKNKSFIETIKQLLVFGEMKPVVSVERETVSLPVPDKVMSDMRSCSAAVIHVEDELHLIDNEGNQHTVLNSNVLIEIGAAIALYGRRFVLLVKTGVTLPSNLSGLYEVRYEGEKLDSDVTIRLLKAMSDIKNHPKP